MDSEAVKSNLRHFTIRAGMGYPHNYNFQIRHFEVVAFAQVAIASRICTCIYMYMCMWDNGIRLNLTIRTWYFTCVYTV